MLNKGEYVVIKSIKELENMKGKSVDETAMLSAVKEFVRQEASNEQITVFKIHSIEHAKDGEIFYMCKGLKKDLMPFPERLLEKVTPKYATGELVQLNIKQAFEDIVSELKADEDDFTQSLFTALLPVDEEEMFQLYKEEQFKKAGLVDGEIYEIQDLTMLDLEGTQFYRLKGKSAEIEEGFLLPAVSQNDVEEELDRLNGRKEKPLVSPKVAKEIENILKMREMFEILNVDYIKDKYPAIAKMLGSCIDNVVILFDAISNGYRTKPSQDYNTKVDFSKAYDVLRNGGKAKCDDNIYEVVNGKFFVNGIEAYTIPLALMGKDWYIKG